jgi:signal transduction histidine kinase/DNA-binding NarL/FixJ family response regulator
MTDIPLQTTVLVVDDEPGVLEAYTRCLVPRVPLRAGSARRPGARPATLTMARPTYRVVAARSGEEAVDLVTREVAEGRHVACGFFDMRMPHGIDGLETIRRARAVDPWMLCTIVTAFQERHVDEINRMFSPEHEDEWDYLTKPFLESEIWQKARCMTSSWLRRRQEEEYRRGLVAILDTLRHAYAEVRGTSDRIPERAAQMLMRMAGARDACVVEAIVRDGAGPPVCRLPDGGRAPIDDATLGRLSLEALDHGYALEGRTLALSLPMTTPARFVLCTGLPDTFTGAAEMLDVAVGTLTGLREHAELWRELRGRGQELERTLGQLKEAQARIVEHERLAAIGQVAAGIAHEINNPLTWTMAHHDIAVQLTGDLAQEAGAQHGTPAAGAPSQRQAILAELGEAQAVVRSGLQRIARIVRDMKRMTSSRDDEPSLVAVDQAARSALALTAATTRSVACVETDLAPDCTVRAHEGPLVQLVTNLVVNAAQAIGAAQDGRAGLVRIRCARVGGEVVLEVEDNGVGIPAEHLDRIWAPLFTTKRRGLGSGLGLAITRDIVSRYGGRIGARSEVGRGSTFAAWFPAVDLLHAGDVAAPAAPGPAARAARAPETRRTRILLVDDEVALLDGLRRLLAANAEVATAHGAREALALLENDRRFDLVLCDVMMPGMDGAEFHAAARARFPDLVPRLALMTGGACTPSTAAFLDTYEGAVLLKPLDVADILRLAREMRGAAA